MSDRIAVGVIGTIAVAGIFAFGVIMGAETPKHQDARCRATLAVARTAVDSLRLVDAAPECGAYLRIPSPQDRR